MEKYQHADPLTEFLHLTVPADVAPYRASVVVMSWGKGDPQRDAVLIVFIDEAGRMRERR